MLSDRRRGETVDEGAERRVPARFEIVNSTEIAKLGRGEPFAERVELPGGLHGGAAAEPLTLGESVEPET